jgi:hypothetical protein
LVPADVARVLDLDPLGRPRQESQLLGSVLPSTFGITHLVLPQDAVGYQLVRRLPDGYALYENPRALPRVYAVGEILPVSDISEARRALLDDDRFSPGQVAVVEGTQLPSEPLVRGSLSQVRMTDREVELQVQSDGGPTFVVVNDRFHSGWHAAIDDVPVAIHRTNGLVRGLFVPGGTHRVTMHYPVPAAVLRGAAMGLVGLLFAIFGACRIRSGAERLVDSAAKRALRFAAGLLLVIRRRWRQLDP